MHFLDVIIFTFYMLAVIGIGVRYLILNKGVEDYYVGGRRMGSWHVGLSVVATDVGGGFSIGLGGLGFIMGIAGSWMLFTGLLGAWLSAVLLIPRVKQIEKTRRFFTFPQFLGSFYNARVAFLAGVISGIGYLGFTSSQILAGAKLASATFVQLDMQTALIIMGIIVIVYTAMGGIKAVIYTDTIQWIILMAGLIFIGIPVAYFAVGGMEGIRQVLPPEFFSLGNISWQQLLNWAVTIIPIWFVGMTLYQRIYATRTRKQAQKAWLVAGLFEWPVMAFMGVLLGLFARVAYEQGLFLYLGYGASDVALDAEMGLPLLLRTVLPVGLMGLMMAAYFSAIMSTADSCLMASSGNFLTDILSKWIKDPATAKGFLLRSQFLTVVLGVIALLLATVMPNVLELMLYSYAFMVSGLFVPVIGALFLKKASSTAAFFAMLLGGGTTITLIIGQWSLPLGLDANIFGISTSFITFFIINFLTQKRQI
jgi:solute:Na+ symporter, SSS family